MASLIKLFPLFIILTLQTCLVSGVKKPNSPVFLLPLIKDKATSLYYTNLNLGNINHSPLTQSLAIDLGGGSAALLRCSTVVKSTTYLPIRCNSAVCKQTKPDSFCFNKTNTCGKYVPTSFTEHPLNTLLGTDSVSLLTSKPNGVTNSVHSPLILSCSNNANALRLMPKVVNGTIGLGNSSFSLLSQLASMHKNRRKLSLCLPSKPAGLGSLHIGGVSPYTNDVSKNLASTPLVIDQTTREYFIDVMSIEIAGNVVPLGKKRRGNVMICTLAPYTVLQGSIYKALVREFVSETKMLRVANVKPFNACFSSKGVRAAVAVPVIDLVMNGGAKWRINRWNLLVKVKRDVVCLGFLDGGVTMKTTEMVIGGFQMEDHLVELDLEASEFSFSSSLLLKNTSCEERPKSKTSPPPSRPKPKTDDVSLTPSLSLVPLVSSSPSDQGSKPKTDDVSLAPHGDSSAFSAETDDRNRGRLCWSSRSLVALLLSSPSDQGSKPKTDDVSLAPHGDSSAFSAEINDRNRGRLCWSSRSLVALLSSSPSDQGSKPKTKDVSLAPHGDSSYFM
ncbi:hypothetical protein Bca101_047422 [Brassica carinata]